MLHPVGHIYRFFTLHIYESLWCWYYEYSSLANVHVKCWIFCVENIKNESPRDADGRWKMFRRWGGGEGDSSDELFIEMREITRSDYSFNVAEFFSDTVCFPRLVYSLIFLYRKIRIVVYIGIWTSYDHTIRRSKTLITNIFPTIHVVSAAIFPCILEWAWQLWLIVKVVTPVPKLILQWFSWIIFDSRF